MKCQWCGKEFPHKKGRFCGTCQRPKGESVSIRGAKQRILDRMECTTFDCDDLRDKLRNKAEFCRECGNDGAKQIDKLETQVIQLQTENERLKENQSCGQCEDDEQNRWCERLNWLHQEYCADYSGCDSGDPLDCVEVEIRQAIENARLAVAKGVLETIAGMRFELPDFVVEAINKKFGLEI